MTFSGSSISNFAGAMGRTFRAKRTSNAISDNQFDPYERAPVLRSDIESLLAEEVELDIAPEEDMLRASERREHDTMCQIRGALYPIDAS